jgi:hypothetical protein
MSEQEQAVTLSLVALEPGDGAPVLAWAAVAISIAGVDIVVHGISIVIDGPELVCRTPHHPRGGKPVSSLEVPGKLGEAIAEFVFGAYHQGLAVAPPTRFLPMRPQ